jgi:hypothetical protein
MKSILPGPIFKNKGERQNQRAFGTILWGKAG